MKALVLALLLCACAHRAAPEDTVRAYLTALDKDDPDAAYKLLSQETRREVTREQFVAHWRENRDAARSESAAVREGVGRGAAEEARVIYSDGLAVPVAHDGGGWRLSDVPTPKVPHAATPEEALDAFEKALAARDYDAIARVITPATREQVDRELRERTAPLKESRKVEVTGDKARIKLGKWELTLERQSSGEWRVVGVK
jgi:hypothetical protein